MLQAILIVINIGCSGYIKSQTEVALSKAKNARNRTPRKFLPGETVYVFRQPKERKLKHAVTPEARAGRKPAWVGPGVVLAVDGPNLWISMRGELSAEQCRPATSEEQLAKELLAGELEAFVRGQLKRSYKDISDGGLPDEDDDGDDPGGDLAPPPAQRQRVQFEDVCQIPVPEGGDEELDYSPSEGGSGGISNVEEEPEREVSTTPLELPQARNGVGLDPRTVETVQRNEQLDGNAPGTPSYDAVRKLLKHKPSKPYYHEARSMPESGSSQAWFSFEDNVGWVFESDVWEELGSDVMVRHHNLPRAQLCNPNKVRGMAMPRRLKHRHTFMFFEDGSLDVRVDNWFKQRRKPVTTSQSWIGFTVFSNRVINTEAFASKPHGQGEVFDHEIKPEDRREWDTRMAEG